MPDEDASSALRGLRDDLKAGTISDAEDFVFRLSGVLDTVGIDAGAAATKGVSLISAAPGPPTQATLKAIKRHLPGVQTALISSVPTFLPALDNRGRAVLAAFFCPPVSATGNAVALTAYLSLSAVLAPNVSPPLPPESRQFVLSTLAEVARLYGIDRLYAAVFTGDDKGGVETLAWEDAVKAACGLPAKVANAVGRWKEGGWAGDVPSPLVPRAYFDALAERLESLMYEVSQRRPEPKEAMSAIRAVLEKLAALGLLNVPPSPAGDRPPQPALLPAFLPRALEHLHPPAIASPYPATFFTYLLLPLPSSALVSLAAALLTHLPYHIAKDLPPSSPQERVKRAGAVLALFLGQPVVNGEAWKAVLLPLLKKTPGTDADEVPAASRRMVVAWAGMGGKSVAAALIDATMEAWSDPKHIRFGTYAQQFSLTHTLLLAISLLPPMDPHVIALSRRGKFIQGVQAYLSHPDAKIRRLGMLVAEIVSERSLEDSKMTEEESLEELQAALDIDEETGEPKQRAAPKPPSGPRRLKFTGMWDGDGDGREEARWLRSCVGVKDDESMLSDDAAAWMLGWDMPHDTPPPAPQQKPQPQAQAQAGPSRGRQPKPQRKPKIVMLDEDQAADPLEGYTSSPSSSRSASPTREYLEEVAADPTLAIDATKKRKLKRPVYVRQLAELLRDKDNPESIEMALQWGEGLVRAKRMFGTEVSENAVAVAAAAVALANPFNLDDFEPRRQGLVTALVACSPRNVPPFLAEQYFTSTYSLFQKSVMLTALAMGARELAGLPVPEPRTNRAIDFPTKTLPPALHAKYISPQDVPSRSVAGQLEDAVDGMRNLLLSKGADKAEATVPEIARERRLRVAVSKRRKVGDAAVPLDSMEVNAPKPEKQVPVVPYTLVAAEYFILPLVNRFWDYFQDASMRESRAVALGSRFRGAGTGMVLSPLILDKFLLTLALLAHAARHAPTFLAVIVPAVLELAVTVGARHLSQPDNFGSEQQEPGERDANVTASALELALAVLDASVDLDAGRSIATEAPQLVVATGEWADTVFEAENSGLKAAGGGGREGRVRAAAAGVVVKVAEIGDKWGRH